MREKTKRFRALLIVGVAFALAAAACGDDDAAPATAAPQIVTVTSIVEIEVPGQEVTVTSIVTETSIVEVIVEVTAPPEPMAAPPPSRAVGALLPLSLRHHCPTG